MGAELDCWYGVRGLGFSLSGLFHEAAWTFSGKMTDFKIRYSWTYYNPPSNGHFCHIQNTHPQKSHPSTTPGKGPGSHHLNKVQMWMRLLSTSKTDTKHSTHWGVGCMSPPLESGELHWPCWETEDGKVTPCLLLGLGLKETGAFRFLSLGTLALGPKPQWSPITLRPHCWGHHM